MQATILRERRRLREQASAIVARHYRRPLTVASVATMAGVSSRGLQRAYELDGAMSFRDELARARLAAAAELLAQQPLAVADVARLVGYAQPAAFARAFRRRYGLAPARFRSAARVAGAGGRRHMDGSTPREALPAGVRRTLAS